MVENGNGWPVANMEVGHYVPWCIVQKHLFNFFQVTIGVPNAVPLVNSREESNIIDGNLAEGEVSFDVDGVAGYFNWCSLKASLDIRREDVG